MRRETRGGGGRVLLGGQTVTTPHNITHALHTVALQASVSPGSGGATRLVEVANAGEAWA